MTNEEAVKELNALLNMCNPSPLTKELEDALKMAIKVLETTCIEDYPTCTECEHYDKDKHYCPRFCQVIKDTLAEAQPSEDCVRREQAKKFLYEEIEQLHDDGLYDCFSRIIDDMYNELPSVTPQRPKGKWIYEMKVMNNPYTYKCSVCKGWEKDKTKYCPNCGAEMSGGGEDGKDSAFN